MTPEQLEAHRARFEQRFYSEFGLEPLRSGPGYVEAAASDAWQAYQWALTDVDRAQRAAPGVKPRLIGWRTSDFLMETADKAKAENWQVHHEIQPIFEGDPHTSLKPPEVQAAPFAQQSAQPVAAANGWAKGLEIRMSQGWKLKGGICPVLYSDTVNGYGVGRDDLWLATTDALKSAQPVEVQRAVPEPTPEMVIAGAAAARDYYEETGGNDPAVIYRAMLAAAPMVDVVPPATSRDRWMYEQGRLAERDPRTHGIKPTSSEVGAA